MTSTFKSWEPGDFARRAAELIEGDRAQQHGDYIEVHTKAAELWNAWIAIRKEHGRLTGRDVLIMLSLLKLARRECGAINRDDAVDGLGYLALSAPLDYQG